MIGGGFARFTYGLLLPAMTQDVLGSYDQAGLLGSISLVAYLAGIVAVRFLARRVEAIHLLWGGLLGTGLGCATTAGADTFAGLAVAMALMAFASAGIWVPSASIVGDAVQSTRRGLALGLVGAGAGIGILVSGELVRLVRAISNPLVWRPVWAVQAGICLVVLLISLKVLRQLPSAGHHRDKDRDRATFRHLRGWLSLGSGYAAFALGMSLYITYVVAALEGDVGVSPAQAASVYSLFGAAAAVGGIVVGRLADQFGLGSMLVASYLATTVCAALITTGSLVLAYVSAALFGLVVTGVGSLVMGVISEQLRGREAASAFATATAAFAVFHAIGPLAGGIVRESTGSFTPVFALAAGAFGLAGIAAHRLRRARLHPVQPASRSE